jgi:hypothetical protein
VNHFRLTGKIRYGNSWAWVECPKDVGDYYVKVAKYVWGVTLSPPLNGPHITLVAGKYETASTHPLWGTREGDNICFAYAGLVHVKDYWWLKIVEDSELRHFRTELGLSEELKYPFHLTVGKDQNYVGTPNNFLLDNPAKV